MNTTVWKVFFSSKLCLILSAALFLVSYGFIIFFSLLGMNGFSTLHTIARFQFYICFVYVILSYLYIGNANRNDVQEASDAAGSFGIYEFSALIFMIIHSLVWSFGMCSILIWTSLKNDGSRYFLGWFFPNYLVNCMLPLLICILLTYFVSLSQNPGRWIIGEISFLFLISPFAEEIIWWNKPDFPIDQIWKALRRPFQILYQNGVWSPDFQSDLQLERVRVAVQFFWLFGAFCFILLRYHKKRFTAFACAAGALSLFSLIYSYQPASTYRLVNSWDGITKDYNEYELDSSSSYEPVHPSFKVSSYDFELNLSNQLEVDGSITLTSEEALDTFVFTLYHGYHVNSVEAEGENQISLTCQQSDDTVTLRTDRKVTQLTFRIRYEGHHHKFYSNNRAAILPGFFPWYPMPGARKILLYYPEYGPMWGYNPYNRIDPAQIRLRSNVPLFTNLAEQDNCSYEGTSDSITVLAGNLQTTGDDIVLTCLPLSLYSDYRAEDFTARQKERYFNTLAELEEIYGVDTTELRNKKLLIASEDMSRNVINNFAIPFGDYILLSPNSINPKEMFLMLMLQDSEHREQRKNSGLIQFFLFNYDYHPEETLQEWFSFRQQILLESEETRLSEAMVKRLDKLIPAMENKVFAKEIYRYIMQPSLYNSDDAFLTEMEKKYG